MAGKLTFGNTNIYFGLLEEAEKEKKKERKKKGAVKNDKNTKQDI